MELFFEITSKLGDEMIKIPIAHGNIGGGIFIEKNLCFRHFHQKIIKDLKVLRKARKDSSEYGYCQ